MKIYKMENFVGGWFMGDFEPTLLKTKDFEVCYKEHKKGEHWDTHYHKIGTEYNYLTEGKMLLQGKELNSGDLFIIEPYEVADPIFLEDCKVVIIKTPSSPKDKYIIKEEE